MTARTPAVWRDITRALAAGRRVTNAQLARVVRVYGVPVSAAALVADRLEGKAAHAKHRPAHDTAQRGDKIARESALLNEWALLTAHYRAHGSKAPTTRALESLASRGKAAGTLRKMRYAAERTWTDAERRFLLSPGHIAVTAPAQRVRRKVR